MKTNRPMKVLCVDQEAILPVNRALYRALAVREGVRLSVLVPARWEGDFGAMLCGEETEPSFALAKGPVLFSGKSHRALYLSLAGIIWRVRPDILYLNAEPESYLAWQAAMLCPLISPYTRIVFISWRNIDYPPGVFPYKLPSLHARAERKVLAVAAHCIAHNQSAKEIFRRKSFSSVTVIPPAVDLKVFAPKRVGQPAAGRPLTIGFVGRFSPEKGLDLLLRAARDLGFEHRLLIVGSGPQKEELLQLAKGLGIDQRVIWGRPASREKIPEYLNEMDLLVLPSRTTLFWKEQFGRVIIEAFACGVPVIGSTSGEIPRVIGDAGLLVPEDDAGALAEAIRRVASDHVLKADLVNKGLDRVRNEFSVEVVARQYSELFSRLAEGSRRN